MDFRRRHVLKTIGAGLVSAAAGGSVSFAQSYPARAVKVIAPYAPGGPPDLIGRLVAELLSDGLGQQFYVENLPGSGGNAGTATAARGPADGYTLLAISTGFFVNPSLYSKAPYDPVKDFTAVSIVASSPNVIFVNNDFPAKTLREMIAVVKANPGKYSYAHASTGSTPHLSGELLKLRYGLDLVTVPFNSGPQAVTSVLGGFTPVGVVAIPSVISMVADGRIRALAVTTPARIKSMPNVPTMAEEGATDQEAETLNGLMAPAGTPREIIDQLYGAIVTGMAKPAIRDRMAALGFEPLSMTPDQAAARTKLEIAKWGKVIQEAAIRIN